MRMRKPSSFPLEIGSLDVCVWQRERKREVEREKEKKRLIPQWKGRVEVSLLYNALAVTVCVQSTAFPAEVEEEGIVVGLIKTPPGIYLYFAVCCPPSQT